MKIFPIISFLILANSLLIGSDELEIVRAKNKYFPPFKDGIWFVMQGGDTPNVNHHFTVPCQFYAIDIAKTQDRALSSGNGDKISDYYSYNQLVIAPCNGKVIELKNSEKNNGIGRSDKINEYGNYIIIDAGKNEYVVLAHFSAESIVVKIDQNIKIGEEIGQVGNSGNSSSPHIHMHVQNSPRLRDGNGLLFEFSNAIGIISGRELIDLSVPLLQGMWLKNKSNGK